MDLELTGKVALVTGASRGIGLEIASVLSREGCRVAMNSRRVGPLRAASETVPGSVVISADVSIPGQASTAVEEAVAAFGALDIVVCNVGSSNSVQPGQEGAQDWHEMISANLSTTTNMVEASLSYLSNRRGNIICVSSICGWEVVPGAPVTYSVAKAAQQMYVRGIARPLARRGVRINAVAPGNVVFPGSVWEAKMSQRPDQVSRLIEETVALSRLGTPSEIAAVVAFLASSRASFVTGATWVVDGGQVRS